jgi:hypothetical protein
VATYIEPQDSAHYQGVDLLGDPVRAATAQQALHSSHPIASAPLQLMRNGAGCGLVLLHAAGPGAAAVRALPAAPGRAGRRPVGESGALQDPERSRQLLRELRLRGITVAIDDFGTGYSSLSYLKLFELDRIKIDRAFVKDIESDANDAVIVAATIGLAHALGLAVVAERVETEAQAAFLRSKRCEEAQGYLFARPMPVGDFEALVGEAMALA